VQKIRNIIELTLLLLLVCTGTGLSIQTYRLDKIRQELGSVRTELEHSRDNSRAIADGLTRTREILSESAVTVQDIRRQISEIRKTFEDMENYINSINNNNL